MSLYLAYLLTHLSYLKPKAEKCSRTCILEHCTQNKDGPLMKIKNTHQEFRRNLAFYLCNRSLLYLSVLKCTNTVFTVESWNGLEVRKNEIMIVYSIHACEVFGHENVGFKICYKKCIRSIFKEWCQIRMHLIYLRMHLIYCDIYLPK